MKCKNLYLLLFVVGSLLFVVGCNAKSNAGSGESATSSNPDHSKTSSEKLAAGKDYTQFTRVRFMDKIGFEKPVEAFSVLIPENWEAEGGVFWNPPGSVCAGTNQGMKAVSPDGKFSVEIFPNYMWSFVTDPQLAQFQQQQQFPQYCSYGEPMNADAYFSQIFAPYDLGNPTIISINENKSGVLALQENIEKSKPEMMRHAPGQVNYYPSGISAAIKWDNNTEAIVLCGVTVIESIIPNPYDGSYNKTYVSSASERVVFRYPAGENEKAVNMLSVIMGSIRTNTAWKTAVDGFWLAVREQSHREHIGRIKMMDEQTRQIGDKAIRQGQQNLNNLDANMRNWEASQQSQDRMHTNFVKAIREVENYSDETGTIELSSGYNHAWSRSDGSSFIMSDDPSFDPASVFLDQSWKEMKRVD